MEIEGGDKTIVIIAAEYSFNDGHSIQETHPLEFPVFTNEGYVIEAGHEFLEYSVGSLSKIVSYQWNGHDRGLWTDQNL